MIQIKTERLILRPWRMEDAEDMYEYARDPAVGPNAGWKPHESLEESRETVRVFSDTSEKNLILAIEEKASGKVIGSVGIEEDGRREKVGFARSLGYVLAQSYWGRGLMTEAANAAIDYAFRELKIKLLSVDHYPYNDRSRRVIEKCGFHFDGRLRQATKLYNGEIQDLCCYSMTAAEYYLRDAKRRGLSLILPEETSLDKIGEYQAEWGEERIVPYGARRKEGQSLEEWLEYNIAAREKDPNGPEYSPSHTYFVVDEAGELLGAANLRHTLTEPLLHHGGHIGYGIRPSQRGNHYAPCMLALCLEKAKERGIDRVLVTCVEDNKASAATIEACGGVLENKVEYEGELFRRYWIDL